jgi:hypothetical protein
MEYFAHPSNSSVEKIPSSENIDNMLRIFKSDSQNRVSIYRSIDSLESYLNLHHCDDSGVDVHQVTMQIQECWGKINQIFEPRESDDDEIRAKIASRENISTLVRYGKANINEIERENRIKLIAKEKAIMYARSKSFASNNRLTEFRSTEEFPYPGFGVIGGDILDIKSVADGARDVAIEGSIISSDVNDLIEKYNLSRITVGSGADATTIIYNSNGVDKAIEVADILESHDNYSEDPQIVFNFHYKIGRLVGIDEKVCKRWSLQRAQSVDPEFTLSQQEVGMK